MNATGRAEFTLGIALVILSLSVIAQEHTLEIEGIQLHPSVYGRYIVYMQDIGGGKYDIDVYDSGLTTDPADDLGVIEITTDGGSHNYAEPVIDGRYIAWLDTRIEYNQMKGTDVYVYDMGEDEIIGPGTKVIKKLNAFDKAEGREYVLKSGLHLSEGVLVWEDSDIKGGDSDIRGYDLNVLGDATDDINDLHHLMISDEKAQTLNGLTERIDESDPFISGKEVVYTSTYLHPFEETAEVYQEIYKKDLSTGTKTLVSDPESGFYFASMPSIDSVTRDVVWVDHFAPTQVIMDENEVYYSTTEGELINPQKIKDNYLFLYQKENDLYLYLNMNKRNMIEAINEHSIHYSAKDNQFAFSYGIPGNCLAFDSFPEFKLAREYENQRVVLLGEDRLLFYMQDEEGLKAKVSGLDEEKVYSLVASGDVFQMFNPISDGIGGGILAWKSNDMIYARSIDQEGNLKPPIPLMEKKGQISNILIYPDNGGGAFVHDIFDLDSLLYFDTGSAVEVKMNELISGPIFLGLGKGKALVMANPGLEKPITFQAIDNGAVKSTLYTEKEKPSSYGMVPDGKGGAIAYIYYYARSASSSIIISISDDQIKEVMDFPYNDEIINIYLDEDLGLMIFMYHREEKELRLDLVTLKEGIFSEPTTILRSSDYPNLFSGNSKIYPFGDTEVDVLYFSTGVFDPFSKFIAIKGNSLEVYPIDVPFPDGDIFPFFGSLYGSRFVISHFQSDPNIYVNNFLKSSIFEIKNHGKFSFPQQPHLLRGDANNDGIRNIADAVRILGFLFIQGDSKPAISCLDTADANDDGILNIADAVRLLGNLYSRTGPLPQPFNAPGEDPTDDGIGCESYG